MATQQTQSIDQITNGALMHARHTLEREVSAQHCQSSGERAHSGTRVAHEKFDGLGVL